MENESNLDLTPDNCAKGKKPAKAKLNQMKRGKE